MNHPNPNLPHPGGAFFPSQRPHLARRWKGFTRPGVHSLLPGLRSRLMLAALRVRLALDTSPRPGLRFSFPRLPRLGRIPAFTLFFILLFELPMLASLRPGSRVMLNGCTIGYVEDASIAEQAAEELERSVSSLSGSSFHLSLDLAPSLTLLGHFQSQEQTVSALAHAAEDVDMLAVLTVNGQTVGACADADAVQRALDSQLERYKHSADDDARFTDDVRIALTPAPHDALLSSEALRQKLTEENLLHVEVTSHIQYTETLPHSTLWVQNPNMEQNVTQTLAEGADGEARIHAEIVSVNGAEQTRTIVSRSVLSRAANTVIAVGTANSSAASGGLMTPLTSYTYTSGFKFRWDHWHKGVDLATPVGSPVYAADGGTVLTAQTSDSYGNYIVIDHGNGLQTLYAHNSALLVRVGDTVSKGTQIALSGNTGNSTGPHLHFEVHQNGTAVNPEWYLVLGAPTS